MERADKQLIFCNAACELSKAKLHFHTIQFLKRSGKPGYSYLPYGSGVLVRIVDHYFIFTASHVTKGAEIDKLYVNTRVGVHQVIGTCQEMDFERDKHMDLAYIQLDKMLGMLLAESYQFLELPKLSHSHKPKQNSNYMVSGYPAKNIWKEGEDIYTGSSHFLMSMADEKWLRHYNFDPGRNYGLSFAGRGIDINTDKKTEKIGDPHGISGCGLWYLQVRPEPGNINLDYVLIGIMTEYRNGKYHMLIGNRLEPIMADMEDRGLFPFDWLTLSK